MNLLEAWDAIENEIPGQFSAEAAAIRAALVSLDAKATGDAWALIEEEIRSDWTGVDTEPAAEMRNALKIVRAHLARSGVPV